MLTLLVPRFKRPQVLPPTPFLLASCVDPGPSVHEWKEHGFRLTVQKGSLHRAIGPIKIQEFFQVVKCEDDSQFYLVKTRVDCQPSGTTFPDNSLLMDFMVKDTPVDKIAQTFQVCVCTVPKCGQLLQSRQGRSKSTMPLTVGAASGTAIVLWFQLVEIYWLDAYIPDTTVPTRF